MSKSFSAPRKLGPQKLEELEILGKKTIICGNDLLGYIVNDLVTNAAPNARIFVIVTDEHIKKLYLKEFLDCFRGVGHVKELDSNKYGKNISNVLKSTRTQSFKIISHYVIPPGEMSKTREMKSKIEDFLLEEGCNRDTCLIAMGGGVIGDLVGFIASTFLRGVPYVQIPTSLLAMVDSSIGGKTGVDTSAGKNLIGAIYQPTRVYVDYKFLTTLPPREFSNGLAEVIKTCAVSSAEDFKYLESNADKLSSFITAMVKEGRKLNESPEILEIISKIIQMSIKFKADVVSEDVEDNGRRQLINFGHTLGHAIEHHYAPHLLHGECVAIGMILEMQIAIGLKYATSPQDLDRLKNVVTKLHLPISIHDEMIQGHLEDKLPITMEQLLRAAKLDKKNSGGSICMILLQSLGNPIEPRAQPVLELDITNNISKSIKRPRAKINTHSSAKKHVAENAGDKSVLLIGKHNESLAKLNEALAARVAELLEWDFFANAPLSILSAFKKRFVVTIREVSKNTEDVVKYFSHNVGTVINIISDVDQDDDEFGWQEHLSNHTMFFEGNINSPNDVESAAEQLVHLIRVANGDVYKNVVPSFKSFRSFFVCLLVPEVGPILESLPSIISGSNAMELRIDQLEPLKSGDCKLGQFERILARQVSRIRRAIKNHPLIYTIRTTEEGGSLCLKSTSDSGLRGLMDFGVRLGFEFIDVQVNMEPKLIELISNKAIGKSRIIASHHSIKVPLDWTGEATHKILEQSLEFGDIVKLVSIANSEEDNRKVEEFTKDYYKEDPVTPLIAFNLGKLGQATRKANRFFTPVTHVALNAYASPNLSQLSCVEILGGLTESGLIGKLDFYLFGYPIAHSLSPFFHNTNFLYFKLPHVYQLMESAEVDAKVKQIIRSSTFGGASVTMPLKISIQDVLDSVSPVAEIIGAVNTIIKNRHGTLRGDNTDWIGIQSSLSQTLKESSLERPKKMSALLIGAGGTARAALYALGDFGFAKIFLCNRTYSKLADLVKCYPVGMKGKTEFVFLENRAAATVERLCDPECPLVVVVDTTPWNCGMCNNSFVNQVFHDRPHPTVLVKLAYGAGMFEADEELLHPGILLVTGVDVMIAQGLAQAHLWTGLKPDAPFLRKALLEYTESKSKEELRLSMLTFSD